MCHFQAKKNQPLFCEFSKNDDFDTLHFMELIIFKKLKLG
jgi:hypothetical protein